MPKLNVCIKCGSVDTVIKSGKTQNNVQRFKCKSCLRTYILDESPTKGFKNSDYLFKKFIGLMIDDVTLEVIARNLNINIKTAHYYRYIVFHALSEYQSKVKLSGTILLDETFISIKEKEFRIYKPDGKAFRGLSRNVLAIITLIDLNGISVAKAASRATPSPKDYIDLLTMNIGNVELFVSDGNTHTKQFFSKFSVERIDTSLYVGDEFNLKLLDSYHNNLKRYLFKHIGHKLKNIQYYLDFYVYRSNYIAMSRPENMTDMKLIKNKMTDKLFKLIKRKEKTITYRSFLKSKGIKDILE